MGAAAKSAAMFVVLTLVAVGGTRLLLGMSKRLEAMEALALDAEERDRETRHAIKNLAAALGMARAVESKLGPVLDGDGRGPTRREGPVQRGA